MNWELTNSKTHRNYFLENGNLTIQHKKKIYYEGSANEVIILHISKRKDIWKNEHLYLILSLPNRSDSFSDIFSGDDIECADEFIMELMKLCEFRDLSYMKAGMYRRDKVQKNESPNISVQETDSDDTKKVSSAAQSETQLSRHDEKRLSVMPKNDIPNISIQETDSDDAKKVSSAVQFQTKLSRHDKKRLSVILKIEKGSIMLFDISKGTIHDRKNHSLPNIIGSNIVMKKGEVCHYSGRVYITKTKNTVVGNVRSSTGVSVRAMKGLYARAGQSQTQVVRADITENTPGMLYVTNKRLVLTSAKYGFDKSLSDLTGIVPYKDGIGIQFNDKIFNLLTKYPILISEIIAVAIENF